MKLEAKVHLSSYNCSLSLLFSSCFFFLRQHLLLRVSFSWKLDSGRFERWRQFERWKSHHFFDFVTLTRKRETIDGKVMSVCLWLTQYQLLLTKRIQVQWDTQSMWSMSLLLAFQGTLYSMYFCRKIMWDNWLHGYRGRVKRDCSRLALSTRRGTCSPRRVVVPVSQVYSHITHSWRRPFPWSEGTLTKGNDRRRTLSTTWRTVVGDTGWEGKTTWRRMLLL